MTAEPSPARAPSLGAYERAAGAMMALSLASLAGFVLGVSFLAAPAKFRVASLPFATALEVGRETFHLSMTSQWIMAGLIAVMGWAFGHARWRWCAVALALHAFEQFALIPPMDARIDQVLAGTPPPESWHHFAYMAVDLAKAAALAVAAWRNLGRLSA